MRFNSSPKGLLIALALPYLALGHTWLEDIRQVGPNGAFGATGYPRGYVARGANPGPDIASVYRLTGVIPQDAPMCGPSQQIGSQVAAFPALAASPGDTIALRYEENGHVTQPSQAQGGTNRPLGQGTVYIYGTTQPLKTDTYLGIHRVWNTAGTGGDKRGVLLATRPYDDGQCRQALNPAAVPAPSGLPVANARKAQYPTSPDNNAEVFCQNSVQIPTSASGNSYTLYWVWEWPLMDGSKQTSNESYTSCADIAITPAKSQPVAINVAPKQDPNSAAIASQISSAFLVNPTNPPQAWVSNGPQPPVGNIVLPAAASGPSSTAPPPAPKPSSSAPPPSSAQPSSSSPPPAPSSAAPAASSANNGFKTITVTNNVPAVTVTASVSPSVVMSTITAQATVAAATSTVVAAPSGTSSAASTVISGGAVLPIPAFTLTPTITKRGWAPRGRR